MAADTVNCIFTFLHFKVTEKAKIYFGTRKSIFANS